MRSFAWLLFSSYILLIHIQTWLGKSANGRTLPANLGRHHFFDFFPNQQQTAHIPFLPYIVPFSASIFKHSFSCFLQFFVEFLYIIANAKYYPYIPSITGLRIAYCPMFPIPFFPAGRKVFLYHFSFYCQFSPFSEKVTFRAGRLKSHHFASLADWKAIFSQML